MPDDGEHVLSPQKCHLSCFEKGRPWGAAFFPQADPSAGGLCGF